MNQSAVEIIVGTMTHATRVMAREGTYEERVPENQVGNESTYRGRRGAQLWAAEGKGGTTVGS